MKNFKPCGTTMFLAIALIAILVIAFFMVRNQRKMENFSVVVGGPDCPYKTDESCPWVKQGSGAACQIKASHAGCPACCGNVDWYLGPEEYKKKCPNTVPPAFRDARDYYEKLQENFMSEK